MWDIPAIKNTLIEIPILGMIWTISQSNRRKPAKKKWDTIKNRSLTGRKCPVARPCASIGYESFLMPPPSIYLSFMSKKVLT